MKLIKRATALLLCFLLLANVPISAFATEGVSGNDVVVETTTTTTLDAVPAGVTPTEETLGTQVAYVANDTVTVYEYYENGALGMVCTGALGEQIELTKKFTYTADGVDTVIYHFADSDFVGAMGAADDANYQFILASDVTFTAPEVTPDLEPTETVIPDSATGISVTGDLPDDVTLTVTSKNLAESGIDTAVYPISGAFLFYDVTLLQNSAEYQPENGITVTFPEAAITNSGLTVGDYYKVYHIHDGVTDVTGPFEYTGGAIEATFYSLSVVGLASTDAVNPTDVFGVYQGSESYTGYAVIKTDNVTVYGDVIETVTTDYIEYSGVKGFKLELSNYKVMYANTNLYYYTYSGTEDFQSYYFIPEEYITLTCCANCTGEAGCTCGCESCTCNSETKQTLTDPATGITVIGVLPAGTQLVVTAAKTAVSEIPGLAVSHLQYKTVSYNGYNISLEDADGNPLADDAFETVTVYVPGVWNTSYSDPIVDVYHLNDDGTLRELLTTRDGTAAVVDGGGVEIEVSGFSDYWFVSGDTDANVSVTKGNHTIYIAPGTTGTLALQSTNRVTLTNNDLPSGVTVTKNTSSQSATPFTIVADSTAEIGTTGSFTITWKGGTASYTVHVVSAEEAAKQQFIANSISHIQINIESSAVVLGYNNDQATTIDLNYDENNSTNNLTPVSDDSSVGFHYELTYTVNNVETTVIVRVDESATKLPTGVTYADIASKWSLTDTSEEDGQISFNGTIPVGTKDYPVVYSVTVESTFNLTPTNGTTAEPVDVSISNNMGYWYTTNECPGIGHSTTQWQAGSVISNSGIDLSKFTMGSVLGETTYYVVFSNLTKVVSGYTFGTDETKNYVFTIYRRLVDDPDTTDVNEAENTWTAFDTISITANGATSSTNFTTDATKYSVDDITKYEYKIVETGYSISGYSCTNVIEVKGTDGNFSASSDGVFGFTRTASDDGKTVTYSAEIKCTNTYSEAGLTVSKVVNNAPASAADDEFTVKVWPKELSTSGIESGTNMYTYFNTGTYKVNGTALTVTNSSSTTEYGYITLTFKAGDSKTITGLPAGTYYVQEVAGANTNYDYDTTQYEANLSSGSAVVTITNTYKFCDLTITKTGWNATDENQSYIFTVTGPNGFKMDVVINGNGSVTIKDLLIGEYTVTENTDWSWRYTPDGGKTKTITLAADEENKVNFDNSRSWIYWLSGDSYNENQFAVKTKKDEE